MYPPVGFHFSVEFSIDNRSFETSFQQASGLTVELQSETLNEGGENRFVHQFPVRSSYSNVTLKRGLFVQSEIRSWCERAIVDLDIEPATVWIKLLNPEHEPLQSYVLRNAWPKRWSVSDFDAETSSVVIETLELAYQFFTIKND